jgi:murein DD-endopeptidase MepM/ murein hydrolase activator NlpD
VLWPVNGIITSGFGNRVDPVTGAFVGFHPGVDIAAPIGTPIHAAQSGTIAYAGWEEGYGNYTCIDHGGGFATCYGHQSKILVTVGQVVVRGQLIGLVGSTGYSTGPHCHFETRVNGVPVNPMQYF